MSFPERFLEAALDRLPSDLFKEIYQIADRDCQDNGVMGGVGPSQFRQRGITISKSAFNNLLRKLREAHFSGEKFHDGIELERRQTHEVTAFKLTYGGKRIRVRYDVTTGILYSLQLEHRQRGPVRHQTGPVEERPTRQKLNMEARRLAELAILGEDAA